MITTINRTSEPCSSQVRNNNYADADNLMWHTHNLHYTIPLQLGCESSLYVTMLQSLNILSHSIQLIFIHIHITKHYLTPQTLYYTHNRIRSDSLSAQWCAFRRHRTIYYKHHRDMGTPSYVGTRVFKECLPNDTSQIYGFYVLMYNVSIPLLNKLVHTSHARSIYKVLQSVTSISN